MTDLILVLTRDNIGRRLEPTPPLPMVRLGLKQNLDPQDRDPARLENIPMGLLPGKDYKSGIGTF